MPESALGQYYIGLMSGTSLDGIDVVIAQRDRCGFKQIAACCIDLPPSLRLQLLQICQDKKVDLQTLGEVDHQFAIACATAVNQLLKDSHIRAEQICAIGSHGQTIFHSPQGPLPFSQQIGDANLIAARTGITCVADFRRMDMAYGGQGAPLVPAFHQALFAKQGCNRVILNIGGIANISILHSDTKVLGYDTGPGNMLMDAWINLHHDKHFDKDAKFAQQGKVAPALLAPLLSDPYFAQAAPKSTGREKFNLSWLQQQLHALTPHYFTPHDVQRTLLEFSAITITEQIKLQTSPCAVYVCGGGALNPLLMQRLQALLPDHTVLDTQILNIDPMFVEAVAFAWLAEQRLYEIPIALKEVTGAYKNAILGAIYKP
ncbi:anhydro-N-acetylmuramic acid kinase [Psychromonas sp. MME1]|uniref:anhydro-N-acetylmuramic acid kinase n=1 Tax=Psychromonas sp. MME1 TaxID=3231032 RepID=UPI0034E2BF5F